MLGLSTETVDRCMENIIPSLWRKVSGNLTPGDVVLHGEEL